MKFHPGMRVRIAVENHGSVLAEIVEVILPGGTPDAVRDVMHAEGITAALLLKQVDERARHSFVFEQLTDGTFRERLSRQAYPLEIVPVELKEELQ